MIHLVARKIWPLKKVGFFRLFDQKFVFSQQYHCNAHRCNCEIFTEYSHHYSYHFLKIWCKYNHYFVFHLDGSSDTTLKHIKSEIVCAGKCFKVALRYMLIVALDLLLKIIRFFKMISVLRTSKSCIWNISQFKCCMLKNEVTFNSIIKYSAVTNCNKYHWLMHFKYSNWFCLLKSCSVHVGWGKKEDILKKNTNSV